MTFLDSAYRERVRLDSVTCVVDAEQILSDDDRDLLKLKLQQIGFADLVILNKVDLAGVEGAATVKRWIDDHFTRVRLVPAIHCEVPLDLLLAVGRFDASVVTDDEHRHDEEHGDRFTTRSYSDERALSRRSLERMIKRKLPAGIYRCKGFVHLADDPDRRYVLQVVGRRVDLAADRLWGPERPGNRIVAIAHRSSDDVDRLVELLDECVVD
jgi:G3E family GTPase